MLPEPEKPESLKSQAQQTALDSWALKLALVALFTFSMLMGGNLLSDADKEQGSTVLPAPSDESDIVSEVARLQIESQFMKYVARLESLDANDEAVKQMLFNAPYLKKDDVRLMLQAAQNNDVKLGKLMLWDNFDQDGDVVQISTEGLSVTIPLSHTPQTYYVPFRAGAPIQITGIVDGGGGITAAIGTSSGEVPLPIMATGQTIVIPNF